MIENGGDAEPTPAFRRVARRARSTRKSLGRPEVTGANTLFAIFRETRSPAGESTLGEQGVSRERAAEFIARGIGQGR